MDIALSQTAVWSSFSTLREGVIIADQQGGVQYANPAAGEMLAIHAPVSLSDSSIAAHPKWRTLLSPPSTLILEIESGSFRIDAYPHLANAVQIQVHPDVNTRNHEFEVLLEASREIAGTLDKGLVLSLMGQQMMDAVHGRGYVIYQWKRQDRELIMLREGGETAVNPQPLSPSNPIYATVQNQSVTVVEADGSAIFPIIVAEEVYGVIVVYMPNAAYAVRKNQLKLLSALSNQANMALETALIFEDIFDRERFYNALGRVNLAINFTLAEKDILSLISGESLHVFNVDGAYIWQVVGDALVGAAAHGHGADEMPNSSLLLDEREPFLTSIVRTGEPHYINDFCSNSVQGKGFPAPETIRSVLAIPLKQEDRITAVLALVDTHDSARFGEADITRAMTFGMQVTISLQNVHLFKQLHELNADLDARVEQRTIELNQESARFKTLLDITAKLSDSLDEDRVSSQALAMVGDVVKATHGLIMLLDLEQGGLILKSTIGVYHTTDEEAWNAAFSARNGLAQMVMDQQTAVIIADTNQNSHWQNPLPDDKLTSVMAVPLVANEEAIGVLMLFHPEPDVFTAQQVELVEAAAVQVAVSINNANLYRYIREQSVRLGDLLKDETVEAAKRQAILESIADGVIVADEDGVIILANQTAVNILHISHRQLIAKQIKNLVSMYGDSGRDWLKTIDYWRNKTESIQSGIFLREQFEIGGKVVLVHLSPVLANEEYIGTVSIFRDITKEVEVDRLKTNFISTVSHELRTPMTSIKGYADLLLMGAAGALSDGQLGYVRVIKQHAERMHMLVNDLLDISEIGAGTMALNLQLLDISGIVTEMVDEYLNGRISRGDKEITVESNINSPLPVIRADSERIIQILTNLIDNAFNYTPEYGRIVVDAYSNDGAVYVTIKDTGIGIAKDDLANIFDRFFRSDEAAVQKVSGTGLGLSIVRTLVEMHGGTVDIDSVEHKGTIVTVSFPIVNEGV